jgi:hypothetical protein
MIPSGIAGGRRRHVGGLGDDWPLVDRDVSAVDVFVQRALVGERNAGGGNGAPQGRRRIDHGRGLLVGDDFAVERAPIDVVVDLAAGPVEGLAEDSGIEEADAGDVFRSAGLDGRGRKQRQRSEQGQGRAAS